MLRTIIGTIAVLFSSLSVHSLALLLRLPDHMVYDSLQDLHSVIDIKNHNDPIRLQHASVGDFLIDSRRCSDARIGVDKRNAHTCLTRQCLHLMNDMLIKDICCLREPGVLTKDIGQELIDRQISPPLRYACIYWVQHLKLSRNAQSLQDPVSGFMREHFLHWLEVLGLIGRLTEVLEMVARLCTLYVR